MNKQEIIAKIKSRIVDIEDFVWWGDKEKRRAIYELKFAIDLVNQLDEPEITEEQAWRVIAETHNQDEAYWLDAKNHYINSISESEQPALPVIPQFVADWIEWCREHKWTLADVLTPEIASFHFSKAVSEWLMETPTKVEHINESIIARAWLFGYTIEPPKTLQVIVKNYDSTVYKTDLPEDEAMKLIEGWNIDDE